MAIHALEPEVAVEVGINAAIIYKNIQYWYDHNKKNDKNFFEGYYWTYNSMKAFRDDFPYLTDKQIRIALDTLENKGYIKTGNYNKSAYDRTKWYADLRANRVALQGISICPPGQMEVDEKANGIALQGEPIPIDNTIISTIDKNNISPKPPYEDWFEEWWKAYPNPNGRRTAKKQCLNKFLKIANLETEFPVMMKALEIQKVSKQWTEKNGQYVPMSLTYLNQYRWKDVDFQKSEAETAADNALFDFLNNNF